MFIPLKNFEEPKRFYTQLGFDLIWEGTDVVQFKIGRSQFLLQDSSVKECANNFKKFLLVESVDDGTLLLSRPTA